MVPAMNLLAGVPIKTAIGTSLAVIIPTRAHGVTPSIIPPGQWTGASPFGSPRPASIGGFLGAKFAGSFPHGPQAEPLG